MRAPTVTYIETDIIICNLSDTENSPLRTTAIRHRNVNPRPQLRIKNYELRFISLSGYVIIPIPDLSRHCRYNVAYTEKGCL